LGRSEKYRTGDKHEKTRIGGACLADCTARLEQLTWWHLEEVTMTGHGPPGKEEAGCFLDFIGVFFL
jgi:hypothetical protein